MPLFSPFNETVNVTKDHQISLDSTPGLSSLRDIITVSGTGSVTNTAGVHVVSTGATASSSAILETVQTGSHQGSNAYVITIGLKAPALPTGAQVILWGYYSATSGYGFGVDVTGYFVFTRTSSVDTRVYQSSWLSDPNPAAGSFPAMFNIGTGNIFSITASWYGEIAFSVSLPNTSGDLVDVVLHRINNNFPIVDNPNCPIRIECLNGVTTSASLVQVGTRDFASLRNENSQMRLVSNLREGLSYTAVYEGVMSLRRKAGSPFSNINAKLLSIESSCTTSVLFKVVLNPTLSSPAWVSPNYSLPTETCMEVDTIATTITNTDLNVHQWIAPPGVSVHAFPQYLQFVRNQPYTLMVRSLDAVGGCAVNLRWSENW